VIAAVVYRAGPAEWTTFQSADI